MASESGGKKHNTASWRTDRVRSAQRSAGKGSPRRRRRRIPLGLYLGCVVLVSAMLAGIGWLLANDLCSLNKAPVTTSVTVEQGDSVGDVAAKLKEAGLIHYKWFFCLTGRFFHARELIDPGVYTLNSDMDYRCLIQSMHHYGSAETVRVTIPEGLRISEVFALLEENGVSTAEALSDAAANFDFVEYTFLDSSLKGDPNRVEGFLFPDTYDFYVDEAPEAALSRLLNNFKVRLADLEEDLAASRFTLRQIVIMASLIEKESGSADDYGNFSSVMYNRLNAGWKLQVDATINYINETSKLDITYKDLEVDSPYNTYRYGGLPVGPICSPGLRSITAALHPNSTNYWYWYAYEGVTHFFTNDADFNAFVSAHPNN